ncbi:GWxTD domain-containing protein [candidate division KSB1 bacterium]
MLYTIIISLILLFSPQTDKKEQAKALTDKGYQLIEEKEYKDAVKTFNKAIKLDKKCKEAHLGKGIAYYKGGNYNKLRIYPEEFIKRAIKIDPDFTEAKIHLGWCYYSKGAEDQAVEYITELLEKEEADPELCFGIAEFLDNAGNYYFEQKKKVLPLLNAAYEMGLEKPELYYMLGWKFFLKDSVDKAIEFYNEGLALEKNESVYQPLLDLGIIYFNLNNESKTYELFNSAIYKMPKYLKKEFFITIESDNPALRDYVLRSLGVKFFSENGELNKKGEAFIRDGFIFYEKNSIKENAFLTILNENQRNEYLKLDKIHEKNNYIKNQFMILDVTPFDNENEVINEFDRRLDYVLKAYRARTISGFDDRGEIYLKYGEPDNRHIINYGALHTESWIYQRLNYAMAFDFASVNGPFLIIPNMIFLASKVKIHEHKFGENVYSITSGLFRERWHLGGIYAMMAARVDMLPENSQELALEISADCAEYEILKDELSNKKIINYFPSNNKESHLNFGHRIASFRDPRIDTRCEIAFGLNLQDLKFTGENDNYSSSIRFYTAFIDSNFIRIINDTVSFSFSSDKKAKEGIAVNQLKYLVPRGNYTLYVQMRNPEGKKIGIYSQNVQVDDYDTKLLSLSDIQFAFNIKDAESEDKYRKNGLNITPYPFFEVSRKGHIFIYYEIYNLTPGKNGRTRYDITYEIKLLEDKESIWRKLFKGRGMKESISFDKKETGNKIDTFDYTSFDLSKLRIGKYELKVKVKDKVSGKEVEKTDSFILMK